MKQVYTVNLTDPWNPPTPLSRVTRHYPRQTGSHFTGQAIIQSTFDFRLMTADCISDAINGMAYCSNGR